MTVGHGIGLGVGNTEAIAVVQSSDAPVSDPPVLVEPATLRVSATAATLGAPADEPGVLSGFVARVGHPDGITAADGTVYLAEDLVATATASLLATAVRQFPGLPADPAVVATHPARWDDAAVAAQRAAFDRAGLGSVSLVPDAVAAVRWLEAAHGTTGESVVAVCDFAAAGLTVSLVRTGAESRLVPPSTFSSLFGGDGLDRILAEHVLGVAAADLGALDPTDAGVRVDLDRLRTQCRTAREQLSTATEVTVPVSVGGGTAAVTLTRAELEEVLRGPLEGALSLVEETLRAHELASSALHTVLLTGGGASTPLLSELAGSLPAPAVVAPHPNRATVQGAAILAAGGAGRSSPAGVAAGAAATTVATDGPDADVTGDTDTDALPVVPTPAAPTAFTEAGPGRVVQPVAAEAPASADPARNRRVMLAAGVGAALVVAAIAGAVVTVRSGDTAGTPLPHLDPVTSSAAATTTPTTTPPPTWTTEVEVDTVAPTTAPPTWTADPVTTTVAVPPAVVTTTTPSPATTTTTTETEDTTPPEETTTPEDTTTTPTTEPEPAPEDSENP